MFRLLLLATHTTAYPGSPPREAELAAREAAALQPIIIPVEAGPKATVDGDSSMHPDSRPCPGVTRVTLTETSKLIAAGVDLSASSAKSNTTAMRAEMEAAEEPEEDDLTSFPPRPATPEQPSVQDADGTSPVSTPVAAAASFESHKSPAPPASATLSGKAAVDEAASAPPDDNPLPSFADFLYLAHVRQNTWKTVGAPSRLQVWELAGAASGLLQRLTCLVSHLRD